MPIVTGIITTEDGNPAVNNTVHAFDKDMRSEQLLGIAITSTAGRYVISYTEDQFQRAEKKTADIFIKVFDSDNNLLGQSEVLFNAPEEQRLDLTLKAQIKPPRSKLSELEQLQESIEPVREGIEYPLFTDNDLKFLTEETIRKGRIGNKERKTIRQRLEFLQLAGQFEQQTNILLDAFYGWFRQKQPQELDLLLDVSLSRLQTALEQAIKKNIIPNISADIVEILERIRSLRFQRGRLVFHRFVGRLVDTAGEQAMSNLAIDIVDLEAEADEQAMGAFTTDNRSIFTLKFVLPGDAEEDASRRLQLTVQDDDRVLATTEISVSANQTEIVDVLINIIPDPATQTPIRDIAPTALTRRLNEQGIRTINDLLTNPQLTDADQPEELERLRGLAKWTLLDRNLDEAGRNHLVENGINGPLESARISRTEFMRNHQALGGDAQTYSMYKANLDVAAVVQHHTIGQMLDLNLADDDDDDNPTIPTGVKDILSQFRQCGCKDCSSAVSPAAYLAHLLDWVLTHIKGNDESISFTELQSDLHQPFGELPTSCAAVEEPVRQVRMVIETLWRFTDLRELDDLQLPAPFRLAYRQLRIQLYKTILTHLGVGFEQLRKATLTTEGESTAAELVAAQRASVSDILGIDASHLDELFMNVDQILVAPSEDLLEQLFAYQNTRRDLFATRSRPRLVSWQRERLESIWQQQDWTIDAYDGEERLPFIDPMLINEDYLRVPLAENPAQPLLIARQQALQAHRQTMLDAAPSASGLVGLEALLEQELDTTVPSLQTLFSVLQSSEDQQEILAAQSSVEALNLSLAGFSQLMVIHEHLLNDEPIAINDTAIDAAWEAVFDILSRAHRYSLFPDWVIEESSDIIFGPKLFWAPLTAMTINPWQASQAEQDVWLQALQKRSQAPIIDPDQMSSTMIVIFYFVYQYIPVAPADEDNELGLTPFAGNQAVINAPLNPFQIWQERRDFIDFRLQALAAARAGLADGLEILKALFNASTSGITLDFLLLVRPLEIEGQAISTHLQQRKLSFAAYRYLVDLLLLAETNAIISSDKWTNVTEILVNIEKQLECAEWQTIERDFDITLHPNRFKLDEAKNTTEQQASEWLHDPIALNQWKAKLDARIQQFASMDKALATAVGDAEEHILPLLRNILVMQSLAAGNTLQKKATWLDQRFLMDMFMDGCQMTTRVSFAIETLQRLVRGVYAQDNPLLEHLSLDAAEDYDSEWSVMGLYVTWRAFLLAYLFPENLLHVSPHLRESYGFNQFKQTLGRGLTPAKACEYGDLYEQYFRDIAHLEVQASCQVITSVFRNDNNDKCGSRASVERSLVHAFALAETSHKVYTANFVAKFDEKDTLSSWRPIVELENVIEIIGAVPHQTPQRVRLIVLFVKVKENTRQKLFFVTFNTDNHEWSKSFDLSLPPGAESGFSAVAVQKRHGSFGNSLAVAPVSSTVVKTMPTVLAIREPGGRIYTRALNSKGTRWAEGGWIPLFGPVLAKNITTLHALIQRSHHEYMMIVRKKNEKLYHRNFSIEPTLSLDDGAWEYCSDGDFAGTLFWPGFEDVYVFVHLAEQTYIKVIKETGILRNSGQDLTTIYQFNSWLKKTAGVDLKSYLLDFTEAFILHDENDVVLNGEEGDQGVYRDDYLGNLYDLLTMSTYNWDWIYDRPDAAVEEKADLLEILRQKGIDIFKQEVENLQGISFNDNKLGMWKIADFYIKQFSNGSSLARVVQDIFDKAPLNVIKRDEPTGRVAVEADAFQEKWYFVPSCGDEEIGPTAQKTVLLCDTKAAYRLKLKRSSGHDLSEPTVRRITIKGNGLFDLTPQIKREDIEGRRMDIQTMYAANKDVPASILVYLKEAYNLLPIYLGYGLQRNQEYEQALLYYRQVFDYLQPKGMQKIDFGLRLEELLFLDYSLTDELLNDFNAHAIAATRRNTFTRQILLLIIRCLIDYADSLFARDNVSDNAQARELYAQALTLLDVKELKPEDSACANILGQLEIEIVPPGQLPLLPFQAALVKIINPDQLNTAISELQAINQNANFTAISRLEAMQNVVTTSLVEIQPAKSQSAVRATRQQTAVIVENQLMSTPRIRKLLKKTHSQRRQTEISNIATIVGVPHQALDGMELPWLREAIAVDNPTDEIPLTLELFDADTPTPPTLPLVKLIDTQYKASNILSGISFDFCIPQNPVIQTLRRRAENNLNKLRRCRNIAGMVREIDPYGAPTGIGSGLVSPDGTIFSGIINAPPTDKRYVALIARAKELVNIAQQIEAGYQNALINTENEAFSVLQAEQSVELAASQVTLQDLGITRANSELGLAGLQRDSAVLREKTYGGWINAGKNEHENNMLDAYSDASEAQKQAAQARAAGSVAQTTAAIAGAWSAQEVVTGAAVAQTVALSTVIASTIAEATFRERAIDAETRAQTASFEASFERRNDEWQLQQGLAAQDKLIGDQQIQLARDGIAIAQQERVIAGIVQAHAADILKYLQEKIFNEEMYRWIASVLEDVYRFFLQEAASIARLAQQQLGFERQGEVKVIQSDYWNVLVDGSEQERGTDRLGITGSARLLKDIYQVDQYAFETRQRKQVFSVALDLAEMFPVEFQLFRKTGEMVFETPQNLLDRQFPGYYLCLIQQVTVSVVALIPSTNGIRASLDSSGISQTVIGGDTFQSITIRQLPERMALTGSTTSSGVVNLEPDAQSLQLPFEGSGFATQWKLRMPKANNRFDYNTMATILFTVELTALHSFDYERQVIEQLDRNISANRAFRFRNEFADAWYDLNNPEQTDAPMVVTFETRIEDFPPNVDNLRIEQVLLYFVYSDNSLDDSPVAVEHLHYTQSGSSGVIGGGSTTIDGVISTRRGNGTSWLAMIGQSPTGTWELALPNTEVMRNRFQNEEIEDILFVITYQGQTPEWPA